MKRRRTPTPDGARKKQQSKALALESTTIRLQLRDSESVRDQAEPYRLTTARFLVKSLTPTWSLGTNRPIDRNQVKTLCRMYQGGIRRKKAADRLIVVCKKEDVEKMLAHVEGHPESEDDSAEEGAEKWPCFYDWDTVVGTKAELSAGNHRAEALKEYVRKTKASVDEGWWICDVYDKDRLPHELHLKLRANREDTTLPDNHGQIWAELAALSSTDETLFTGTSAAVEGQMLEKLGLGGRARFPVKRLCTIWKNSKWRDMITRWCKLAIGRLTFNISTCEWMARCRIDDFWFGTFNGVIEAATSLSGKFANDIHPNDWKELVRLGRPRNMENVRKLFYPEASDGSDIDLETPRRAGFLMALDDEAYASAYEITLNEPDLCFPDVHAMLAISKQEGNVMSTIISHVVHWLNRNPAKVGERENNKPPLRKDFLLALRERYGDEADKQSIALEREILTHVREHTADFMNAATESYLKQYPDGATSYTERFEHRAWKDLLVMVRRMVGPHFQNEVVSQFNSQDPEGIYSKPASTIAQAMCKFASRIPEVSQNPALQDKSALDALFKKISPSIMEWALERCEHALANENGRWSDTIVQLLQAEATKYRALVHSKASTSGDESSRQDEERVEELSVEELSVEGVGIDENRRRGCSSSLPSSPATWDLSQITQDDYRGLQKSHRMQRRREEVVPNIGQERSGKAAAHNDAESVNITPAPTQKVSVRGNRGAWRD